MGAAVVHDQDTFETLTVRVRTPDGTMFVIILEDKAGKPIGININIGKAGSPLVAWAQATAVLITRLLESGIGVNDIISELSELRAERAPVLSGAGQVPIRSGPDGLCFALMEYRKSKFKDLVSTLEGGDENYRPPTLAQG